mmetsp:Transcript_73768/g.146240  ORF Transcript_73768/g.146240 Transcript_73768/m.146240 type:complete len:209 (+) Transcript_73768:104-730(+)
MMSGASLAATGPSTSSVIDRKSAGATATARVSGLLHRRALRPTAPSTWGHACAVASKPMRNDACRVGSCPADDTSCAKASTSSATCASRAKMTGTKLPRPPGCLLRHSATCAFSVRSSPTSKPFLSVRTARTSCQWSPQAPSDKTTSQRLLSKQCLANTRCWSLALPCWISATQIRLQAAWKMWLHLCVRNHCTRMAHTAGLMRGRSL